MKKPAELLFSIFLILSIYPSKHIIAQDTRRQELAEEVRQEAKRTWESYKKFAWGHDVLKPISGGYHDWYKE
ncbi:MAG TPA: glycoside hydrolase family 47 protein, partial [Bacteroidales bacterium]|nr:glycoside hydrolase family 47 protein [Bacteroidales bacterium]